MIRWKLYLTNTFLGWRAPNDFSFFRVKQRPGFHHQRRDDISSTHMDTCLQRFTADVGLQNRWSGSHHRKGVGGVNVVWLTVPDHRCINEIGSNRGPTIAVHHCHVTMMFAYYLTGANVKYVLWFISSRCIIWLFRLCSSYSTFWCGRIFCCEPLSVRIATQEWWLWDWLWKTYYFCPRLNVDFVYEVDQRSFGIEWVSITYTCCFVCNVYYEGRVVE